MTLRLEDGQKFLKICNRGVWVRTDADITSKSASQHKGQALLRSVDGSHAVVLPAGHRREETVPLAKITLHRARTSYINGISLEPEDEKCFYIASQKMGFWTGLPGALFSQFIRDAKQYASATRAKKSLGQSRRLKKHIELDKCEVINSCVAEDWLEVCLESKIETVEVKQAEQIEKESEVEIRRTLRKQMPQLATLFSSNELKAVYDAAVKSFDDVFEARSLFLEALEQAAANWKRVKQQLDTEIGSLATALQE
jgi:hypothetical protein